MSEHTVMSLPLSEMDKLDVCFYLICLALYKLYIHWGNWSYVIHNTFRMKQYFASWKTFHTIRMIPINRLWRAYESNSRFIRGSITFHTMYLWNPMHVLFEKVHTFFLWIEFGLLSIRIKMAFVQKKLANFIVFMKAFAVFRGKK